MVSQAWRPAQARAQHVWTAGSYVGAILLLATPALSDTIHIGAYDAWRWNGFSWSPPPRISTATAPSVGGDAASPAAPPSPLAAALTWSSGQLADTSVLAQGTASLSGFVYVDKDNNGILDASDVAIIEAKVSLTKPASSDPPLVVYSSSSGSYSFTDLAPGIYTITLLSLSNRPGKNTLGVLRDQDGNVVTTDVGMVGAASFSSIRLEDGYSGTDYDFAQLVYPAPALSKRLLLNEDPGIVICIPEPSSLALLGMAGLLLGGLAWRRRTVKPG